MVTLLLILCPLVEEEKLILPIGVSTLHLKESRFSGGFPVQHVTRTHWNTKEDEVHEVHTH